MTENNNDDKDEIEALAKLLTISCQKHRIREIKKFCPFHGFRCPLNRFTFEYGCEDIKVNDWLRFFEKLKDLAKEAIE